MDAITGANLNLKSNMDSRIHGFQAHPSLCLHNLSLAGVNDPFLQVVATVRLAARSVSQSGQATPKPALTFAGEWLEAKYYKGLERVRGAQPSRCLLFCTVKLSQMCMESLWMGLQTESSILTDACLLLLRPPRQQDSHWFSRPQTELMRIKKQSNLRSEIVLNIALCRCQWTTSKVEVSTCK